MSKDMIHNIYKISAGKGSNVALIIGSEKTALYDAGMAYWGNDFIDSIKKHLKGRKLDYVLLTHTHYDHIGGLPFLRNQWPDLLVYGSEYGKNILERPGALKKIRELSDIAARTYLGEATVPLAYDDRDLFIDIAVKEGDEISLGDCTLVVYETKGHTNCSLSYFIPEEGILFASESTGVMINDGDLSSEVLSSYDDAIASIEKCRALNPKYIFSPHFLRVSEEAAKIYWDMALHETLKSREEIQNYLKKGYSTGQILEAYRQEYKKQNRSDYQPVDAFLTNMQIRIDLVRKSILQE